MGWLVGRAKALIGFILPRSLFFIYFIYNNIE